MSVCVRKLYSPFMKGTNLINVEGNASVYQVNPVSRTTGDGRAEFLRSWGPGFDQYIYEPLSGIFLGTSPAPYLANDLHLGVSSNSSKL